MKPLLGILPRARYKTLRPTRGTIGMNVGVGSQDIVVNQPILLVSKTGTAS
jgi:hypothetical protein